MTRRNRALRVGAYLAVVVVSAGSGKLAANTSTKNTRDALEAQAATHRVELEDFALAIAALQRDFTVSGCGRSKTDRTVTASAFAGQATYLELVLDAASVKEDVKRAARTNWHKQLSAAESLRSRTGRRLNCKTAFPPVTRERVRDLLHEVGRR